MKILNSHRLRLICVWILSTGITLNAKSLYAGDAMQDEPHAVVQDFEGKLELTKWPADKTGVVELSKEWKSDGIQSLKIDSGLMVALFDLKLKDWSGYSVLRIHLNNPTGKSLSLGFELQDPHSAFHERHQNSLGAPVGEHVIEIDISGGLWRGEENRPYRGKIKTPIEMNHITRLSFTNNGDGPIYIDQLEVIKLKKLETPSGFAFDFCKAGNTAMGQWICVPHNQNYDDKRGYGFNGHGATLSRGMSYPTPMLGTGVGIQDGGFKVVLPSGDYLGWIAFERGGFWEGEQSCYEKASLQYSGNF
jgi:hypothetical protein